MQADLLDATEERVDISVVIPCLNEAETLGLCIDKALRALKETEMRGEVIVADNGSTDGSQGIARSSGARVVDVAERGYGSALMHGIEAAKGRFIVMGDADDSYDFGEIPALIEPLLEGHSLVQGCRLPSGGGQILPGAMPFLHRYWGNPMFSALARKWFGARVHDIYCGLRAFTKDLYSSLDMRCLGMEFATEMIIKASLRDEAVAEVPITLHPDGRSAHTPHLRTFRDGWRTLRLFLMYSPRWLFAAPGMILMLLGVLGYALALPGLVISGAGLGPHTLLLSSVALLCGYQSVLFSVLGKIFAVNEGWLPEDSLFKRFFEIFTLERGMIAGALSVLVGLACFGIVFGHWSSNGFGALEYSRTMRWVVPGATLVALGFQTGIASFFGSVLGMRRRSSRGGRETLDGYVPSLSQ